MVVMGEISRPRGSARGGCERLCGVVGGCERVQRLPKGPPEAPPPLATSETARGCENNRDFARLWERVKRCGGVRYVCLCRLLLGPEGRLQRLRLALLQLGEEREWRVCESVRD